MLVKFFLMTLYSSETDAFNIQLEYFMSYTNILFVVFAGAHSQNVQVRAAEDHFIVLEPEAIQLLKSFLFSPVKLTVLYSCGCVL